MRKISLTLLAACFIIYGLTLLTSCVKVETRPVPCFTVSSNSIRIFDSVLLDAGCSFGADVYYWSAFPSDHWEEYSYDASSRTGKTIYFRPDRYGKIDLKLKVTNYSWNRIFNQTCLCQR